MALRQKYPKQLTEPFESLPKNKRKRSVYGENQGREWDRGTL